MMYLGDFLAGDVVHFTWDTNGADGASITRATNGTISVYKDNGTTQSTAGITDTEDFDALTGVHACTIDLSSDGSFYAAGSNFSVVLSAATIDGKTVNATLAHFSIENRVADVRRWLGSTVATPTVAGVPTVDVTHWIGTAAATPTIAGVPEVDLTHVAGAAVNAAAAQLGVNLVNVAGAAVNAASAQLGVNVVQLSGDATAADNLEAVLDDTPGVIPWFGILDQGTAQAAAATSLQLRAATPYGADDVLIGAVVLAYGSNQGYWQSRSITDYVALTKTVTVDTWDVTPSGTVTYKIFAGAPASASAPVLADVRKWNNAAVAAPAVAGVPKVDATHVAGAAVDPNAAQLGVNAVQAGGTAWGSGAITAASIATGAIDADALAADAVDEIIDEVIVGSYTLRQILRGIAAALLGKASGMDTTTAVLRAADDSKAVITATVDANGNRTAVTLDLT